MVISSPSAPEVAPLIFSPLVNVPEETLPVIFGTNGSVEESIDS